MEIGFGVVAALLILGFLVYRWKVPSWDVLLERAILSRDIGPLIAAIFKRRKAGQPAVFNHAIRSLWDRFERELAVKLVRELALNYADVPITQYWLKQVQQVEPKLAKEQLGQEFYEKFYLPEMAAQCGSLG